MRVAVPKETAPGERRVALVPDAAARLVKAGLAVAVEAGAGAAAHFADEAYAEAGAAVGAGGEALLGSADVVLKVRPPAPEEVGWLRAGAATISFLQPQASADLIRRMADRGVTAFSMDLVPRITRAQPMDALSSQGTVAGYKAVLVGAAAHGRFLPMLITAAGTIVPARVLVLGAGVSGLQAIATARRLGAMVYAFDVRAAVKQEVESLGATFVEADLASADAEAETGYAKELSEDAHRRERTALARHVAEADLVISTAAVPGKSAPVLITEEMVKEMRPGSVIVDLAAEGGGNCALTERGGEVVRHGVRILGPVNLASTMPTHASQMYAKNVSSLLLHLVKDGELRVDLAEPITEAMCVTHAGRVLK